MIRLIPPCLTSLPFHSMILSNLSLSFFLFLSVSSHYPVPSLHLHVLKMTHIKLIQIPRHISPISTSYFVSRYPTPFLSPHSLSLPLSLSHFFLHLSPPSAISLFSFNKLFFLGQAEILNTCYNFHESFSTTVTIITTCNSYNLSKHRFLKRIYE